MNNGKPAIFIDIDGCLISDSGNVSKEYYQALYQLSQLIKKGDTGNGPSVRLCSGRNINCVDMICAVLGIVNSFMIIENGTALLNPRTRQLILHPNINGKTKKIFRRITSKRIPIIKRKYPGFFLYLGNIIYFTFERKTETPIDIETMYQGVRREFSDLIRNRSVKVFYSRNSVNIGPAKIDKGNGIRFLAEKDNLDLSQSLAIGDSKQDIPAFRQVKFIGCPSNASERCKEYVKGRKGRISPYSYAKGVVDIIKYFNGDNINLN
ncbi:MAG: HAD hydrolase family protein [Candidatus Nealsonbacteria bacterium]